MLINYTDAACSPSGLNMIKRENKNKIFVIILKFVDLLPAEEPLLYG